MFDLIADFAIILLVAALFTSLLIYCLRMRVVGGHHIMPWQRDAFRDKQPIRYWIGITALALGTAFSWFGLVYLVLLELRG